MTVLASNPDQIENFYNTAQQNPYIPDLSPGFTEGSIGALGTGFERGELEIANFFAPDEYNGTIEDAMKMAKPDPQVTGWLGEQLYGLTSALPALTVGTVASGGSPLGGATLLAGTKGYTRTGELEAQGVDKKTAIELGVVEGATQAAGVMFPAALPGGIATRIASGSAFNAAIGAANRGTTGAVLNAAGYSDMAKQYKILDGGAIFTDAVLGGVFGAMHKGAAEPLPSEVDAALAANNIHHLEIESAPGIPTDIASRNAHVDAMTVATEQMLRGDDVNVANIVADKNFLPKESDIEVQKAFNKTFTEEGYNDISSEKRYQLSTKQEIQAPKQSGLLEFISKSGGIKDEGGDLQSMDAQLWHHTVPFRKKLINENGISQDDMAGAAWESGYFPDHTERPTINDFQKAVAEELAGKKRYAGSDVNVEKPIDVEEMHHWYNNKADELGIKNKPENLDDLMYEVHAQEGRIADAKDAIMLADQHEMAIHDAYPEFDIPFKAVNNEIKTESRAPTENAADIARQKTPPQRKGAGAENDQSSGIGDSLEKESQSIAQQIAIEKPDAVIPISETETRTASEALAQADNAIAEAEQFSKLFDVAVNCFLRNGQ